MSDTLDYPVSPLFLGKQNEGAGIELLGLSFGMFLKRGGESITAGRWDNIRWLDDSRNNVIPNAKADTKEESLRAEFIKRADLWEKETAIFSDPASMYLNRNYMVVITKGIENPRVIVPLILDRLVKKGGDWFFALEKITDQNPAENCTSYESALSAWRNWASKNL